MSDGSDDPCGARGDGCVGNPGFHDDWICNVMNRAVINGVGNRAARIQANAMAQGLLDGIHAPGKTFNSRRYEPCAFLGGPLYYRSLCSAHDGLQLGFRKSRFKAGPVPGGERNENLTRLRIHTPDRARGRKLHPRHVSQGLGGILPAPGIEAGIVTGQRQQPHHAGLKFLEPILSHGFPLAARSVPRFLEAVATGSKIKP